MRARHAAFVLGLLVLAPGAAAAPPRSRVVVGDMGGSGETRQLLRRVLGEEIDRSIPERSHTGTAWYELSGSVTHLVRVADATGVVLSCEVSLLLVEKPGGSLRALLSGRAHLNRDRKRAVEAGGDEADVEEALRIAVRGALRPLRTAVGLSHLR
jgi:Arc/MetJ family transcription regulator